MTDSKKILGVSTNHSFDVGDHSVYVCNLPHNPTVNLLEREFTNFGCIVPGGVQVKWNPASPVTVVGHYVIIEKKKTPVRVRNGMVIGGPTNQFPPRSCMRNEIFRGNGDFVRNFSPERGNFSAPGRFRGFPPHGFQNQMQPQGFFQNGKERMGKGRNFQNGDGMIGRPRRI